MKYGIVWEQKTPVGNFSIRTDWNIPHSEIGKFKPFWNGCGIGPGTTTIEPAQKVIESYAMVRYEIELEKALDRLTELRVMFQMFQKDFSEESRKKMSESLLPEFTK